MKVEKTDIEGLLLITPVVYSDPRGYFVEPHNRSRYDEHIGNVLFVQDNISRSVKGTIRGLHYQVGEYAQGKLCQVLKGEVLDVAVDIRFNSPTFGHHIDIILSEDNHQQLWIPPGFAHGFSVLSDEAVFMYKCSNYYNKESERAIIYNDADLDINWQVTNPLLSPKDLEALPFRSIEKDFIYGAI